MYKRSMFLVCSVIVTGMAGSTMGAATVDLKVDLALPFWESAGIWTETAKPGWTIWGAGTGWGDMMQHDFRAIENLDGTAIDASITILAEGRGSLKVKGLCMDGISGDTAPTGTPEGEPIANSWYYAQKNATFPRSNVVLTLYDLPAGEYALTSYHNYWEPCSSFDRKCTDCEPNYLEPMPVVRAMSFADGFEYEEWLGAEHEGVNWQWHDAFNKIRGQAGPEYGTNVIAVQNAYNVQPSWVYEDKDVATSVIQFFTDGSPVMVMYEAPEYEDAMSLFVGGRGVLNAFELKLLEAVMTASLPRPFDTTVDVPRDKVLTWLAGIEAVEHDVYFGTDRAAVANASDPNVYPGRGRQSETTYDPGGLALDTTYYWRIDEINHAEQDSPWVGNIWTFTTMECDPIEGFESYNDTAALQAAWAQAGAAWVELSIDNPQSGDKAMELAYYNRSKGGDKYSEAGITFAGPQDFIATGASGVGVPFRGMAGNVDDKMYVTLEDADGGSATVFKSGEAGSLIDDTWQSWEAAFEDFAAGGINLGAVTKLIVGVGDKSASPSGAVGMAYIDDIGLCGSGGAVPVCPCLGDLDSNSQVDLDDLQALAGILLDAGSPFIVPLEPGHCADLTGDDQKADLDDLQALAGILLDAGSPFIADCN